MFGTKIGRVVNRLPPTVYVGPSLATMLLMTLNNKWPRVVIVGAGFAGINAAKALAKAPVQVVVIDRKNHHTFQPLLYQVALAVLSPADIAQPIRGILRRQQNTDVLMDEVVA